MVVNLQGDLPALDPSNVRAVAETLAESGADIATLAAEIDNDADRDNPSVVKPVVAWDAVGLRGRALYFTRARAPHGDGALFHHVGIYAFTRAALARFVALPPSPLERREKLEQLRALEAGMTHRGGARGQRAAQRRYGSRSRESARTSVARKELMSGDLISRAKTVAFQGEPGAYAHLAAREAVPHAEAVPRPTFDDAMKR